VSPIFGDEGDILTFRAATPPLGDARAGGAGIARVDNLNTARVSRIGHDLLAIQELLRNLDNVFGPVVPSAELAVAEECEIEHPHESIPGNAKIFVQLRPGEGDKADCFTLLAGRD
jgi:hypothetical protein